MKHGKAYRIFMYFFGGMFIAMGLALFTTAPVGGIIFVVLGILAIVSGRKRDKQQEVTTLEQLVEKYPPHGAQGKGATAEGEKHHIAGTSFRQEAIESLGERNDVYEYTKKELIDEGLTDRKIYEMTFHPRDVQLVEEPDNPEDPNAIKVIIDGVHVGYIKKGSTAHVKKLLHSGTIQRITAWIGGGKYKIVESDYDDETEKETYSFEKDESDYYVSIRIITKED